MERNNKVKFFKKDDAIVYPLQGVGIIRDIEQRKFKGKKIDYYNIYLKTTDMTIMVPVDKASEFGIRSIISKAKATSLLEKIEHEEGYPLSSDWKMRYQNSVERIKAGAPMEIAKVLKTLYLRSKAKDLPIMERKLYDLSLKALITELALATKRPEENIQQTLFAKFEAVATDSSD